MNSAFSSELDVIQQDQARLHQLVSDIDKRIQILSRKLEKRSAPELPPRFPVITPPPLPSHNFAEVDFRDAKRKETNQLSAKTLEQPRTSSSFVDHKTSAAAAAAPIPPADSDESWEFTLGTVWLARIGIVILITGLVFLGNYAWQHVVSQLGAGGKLSLLYLAGIFLGGLGMWMARARESMRNYARVLTAGAAATIYYATYAAHFVERLRVIESPILGGLILLGLSGAFIVWANRHQSQPASMLAILLAYYTSAINEIGVFTLFSGFILTATAMYFLVRHRWAALGWMSLAGTYGSYTFWRFHAEVNHAISQGTGESSLFLAVTFLAGYWFLFSAAAFLGKDRNIPPDLRPTLFVTTNNGVFFTLAAHQIAAQNPGSFWLFSLVFGGVLLGCSVLARRRAPDCPPLESCFLAQGLALVTLGLISKLTGPQLSLVLALESTILLTGAGRRHGLHYRIASSFTGAAATGIAVSEVVNSPHLAFSLGLPVTVLMAGNAWWLKNRRGLLTEITWNWQAAGFIGFGLLTSGTSLMTCASQATIVLFLVGIALLATFPAARLRLPELLLGQAMLGLATALVLLGEVNILNIPASTWSVFAMIAAALGLEQWWQRQRGIPLKIESCVALQMLCSGAAMVVTKSLLATHTPGQSWIWVTCIASVSTLIYGILTRAWATAILGQVFTLFGIQAFLTALWFSPAQTGAVRAFIPVATLVTISLIVEHGIQPRYPKPFPDRFIISGIARIYRLAATSGLVLWAVGFIPSEWLAPFFAGIGTMVLLAGAVTCNRSRLITGAFFQAIALFSIWARMTELATWPSFFAIVAVPASIRIGRLLTPDATLIPNEIRHPFTAAATCTLWLWATSWTVSNYGTQGLTMAWSVLALLTFVAGLGLRERVYRIGGFCILALAIGRIFLVDVWRLETLYRILSFLVLGFTLLSLGYVYNRYADKIRRWL